MWLWACASGPTGLGAGFGNHWAAATDRSPTKSSPGHHSEFSVPVGWSIKEEHAYPRPDFVNRRRDRLKAQRAATTESQSNISASSPLGRQTESLQPLH